MKRLINSEGLKGNSKINQIFFFCNSTISTGSILQLYISNPCHNGDVQNTILIFDGITNLQMFHSESLVEFGVP